MCPSKPGTNPSDMPDPDAAKADRRRAIIGVAATLRRVYAGTVAEPLPPAIVDLLRKLE